MKNVRIFFDITTNNKYASAYRGWQVISLGYEESFDQLKMRLLTDYASNKMFFMSAHKYVLGIHFTSVARLPKAPFVPQGKNSVLYVYESIERKWEGSTYLVLSDMCRKKVNLYNVPASVVSSYSSSSSSSFSGIDASDDYSPYDAIVPLSTLQFSTEWLIHSDNEIAWGTDVLHSLNGIIENVSTKCGILQKFQVSRDIWREEYVVLEENRIYFHPINQVGSGAYSCIELKPSMRVFGDENNNVITVSHYSKNTIRKNLTSVQAKKDDFIIKLRTRSKEDAMEWLRAIQSRGESTPQNYIGNDNDEMYLCEKLIENTQKLFFEDTLENTNHLSTFEGMLHNRYLRENFRSFLEKQYSDEFLKFWEYAEDYRRGHPQSPQPFNFEGNADHKESVEVDAKYIKEWATSVFEAFLRDGASHQISDCSSEDRTKIAKGLEAEKPSWAIFAFVQSLTFRSLKFTWYPQFVKSKHYDIKLRAASEAIRGPSPEECLQKFLGASYGENLSFSDIEKCVETSPVRRSSFFGKREESLLGKLSGVFKKSKNSTEDTNSNAETDGTSNHRTSNGVGLISIATPWRRGQMSTSSTDKKVTYVSSFATGGSTPFDNWITREWWDHVDRNDMDSWRRLHSGEFEAGLRKIMPSWMPVDRAAVSYMLNSLHVERVDRTVEALSEVNLMVSNLQIVNRGGHLSRDLIQNQFDKIKQNYPYSDAAARIYPNDISTLKQIIVSTPKSIFSRTAQLINLLSCAHSIRGVVIFYCDMICNSFRVRKNGYTGGTNQYSIEPTEENEMALPDYAAAHQRYMEMFDLLQAETEDDASIQNPIYTERFANEYSNTFRRDGGHRLCILTETRENEGLLYLLDTTKGSTDGSEKPISCVVNLNTLTKVSPAENTFSRIELYDGAGLIWQLHPIGVDEDDANASTKTLLQYVSMYMNKAASITRVIKQGVLMKRGHLNTSWQSRWCILSSDLKLRYYKYENGQYQGTIDIATVSEIQHKDELDTTFTLLAMERNWVLQAPTYAEKKNGDKTGWIDVMCSMLEDIGSRM